MLVLDEASSALDSESELVVQDALDNIVEQKNITTIIIAHRLSTIRNADKIHVIVGGTVKEEGTHEKLMSYNSYYRRLVEKQDGIDDKDNLEDSKNPSRRGSKLGLPGIDDAVTSTGMIEQSTELPHIEFMNVSFSYPSRPKKTILDCFNLVIEQGQTLALVG